MRKMEDTDKGGCQPNVKIAHVFGVRLVNFLDRTFSHEDEANTWSATLLYFSNLDFRNEFETLDSILIHKPRQVPRQWLYESRRKIATKSGIKDLI